MNRDLQAEAQRARALLATLCVQLEAGGAEALSTLRAYTTQLQNSVEATRPAERLLLLPPELVAPRNLLAHRGLERRRDLPQRILPLRHRHALTPRAASSQRKAQAR